MTTAAIAHDVHQDADQLYLEVRELRLQGFLLFLISDCVLFSSFIFAYLYLRCSDHLPLHKYLSNHVLLFAPLNFLFTFFTTGRQASVFAPSTVPGLDKLKASYPVIREEAKVMLAKEITARFHSAQAADDAEFEEWWKTLSESEQGKVDARVRLLMERGPNLGFPFSSDVKSSRFPEMRELRVQAAGDPLRILYAFDSRRTAILLVAGDKTGDNRWYEVNVPIADRLFERHLKTIASEETGNGQEV